MSKFESGFYCAKHGIFTPTMNEMHEHTAPILPEDLPCIVLQAARGR